MKQNVSETEAAVSAVYADARKIAPSAFLNPQGTRKTDYFTVSYGGGNRVRLILQRFIGQQFFFPDRIAKIVR